jgi:hypothetical protein
LGEARTFAELVEAGVSAELHAGVGIAGFAEGRGPGALAELLADEGAVWSAELDAREGASAVPLAGGGVGGFMVMGGREVSFAELFPSGGPC